MSKSISGSTREKYCARGDAHWAFLCARSGVWVPCAQTTAWTWARAGGSPPAAAWTLAPRAWELVASRYRDRVFNQFLSSIKHGRWARKKARGLRTVCTSGQTAFSRPPAGRSVTGTRFSHYKTHNHAS